MELSGLSPDGRLVEIAEVRDHPWYLGSQFHPEFKSRPERPHPLFRDFVGAAWQRASERPVLEEPEEERVGEVAVPAPNQ
jgi:CTP synthase